MFLQDLYEIANPALQFGQLELCKCYCLSFASLIKVKPENQSKDCKHLTYSFDVDENSQSFR